MRNEHKRLSVRLLRKRAENGVFRPNISVVEKKCVVFTIVCCDIYRKPRMATGAPKASSKEWMGMRQLPCRITKAMGCAQEFCDLTGPKSRNFVISHPKNHGIL